MEARHRRAGAVIVHLAVVGLLLWGGDGGGGGGCARAEDAAVGEQGEWVNTTAHISTSHGIIVVELADEWAPVTVTNFVSLADQSFYDGMRFHRVIDDFVIQTGDPNSKDNNPYNDGSGGSDRTIPLEIHENLTHEDGAIGMARSNDPDSASSQFYICDGAQHGLDGNYAVFGYVVEGMEAVRAIASVETYGSTRPLLMDHPREDVWMFSVRITHGHYNQTHEAGPTEPVSGGYSYDLARGGAIALGAAPLVVIPIAFVLFRRSRRRRGD